ncbi:hypothetical protein BRARA_A03200 [Brassica rapa]|uniref:BnaA01g37050D protein n=3 Tax=Brassica TaxID=3705 RepID=A0A078J737_BRANA|nr:uncharacterized protein LOC103842171 [Brassica rapa]XP_013728952.1 uncharacterized protein LOC106432654 [Brassica napus]XP_048595452.1 uncharacterized protein LOC106432654 [Brassica napus]KAH0943714.1 hypothetical protein HID58_003351 [Brassica napus]RID80541.1 hypothetical protein BRARA_A03200 [Brassica rapa]CAF2155177.1 unnamed protein product [Brassica napus]CDY60693.1 BnaA01g37050D [Brassica napus]
MAFSTKLCLPLQTQCFVPKTVRSKTLMLQQSHVQVKVKQVTVPQPIRYSTKNTVYEDPVQGILCYTDDNGEVICEGYDEGPRCPPESPVVTSYSREVEILDLLQRSYQELRVAEKGDGQRQEAASQQELNMIKWSSFDFL